MRTITKKMKSLVVVMLLFATGQLFAGAPTWTRVDYTNSTTFVGVVKIIQYTPTFGYTPVVGDYIGAFVGTECRMIAKIFPSGNDLYVSSVIQGGQNCAPGEPGCLAGGSEKVTFKLWSNVGNAEYANISGDTLTYPGSNIGSTNPYVIGRTPITACAIATIAPTVSAAPTVCTGKVATLTATGTGTAFTWYSDAAGTIQIATGANYIVTATATKNFYVKQSTSLTCVSPIATGQINVNQLPSINAVANPSKICIGGSSTLTVSGIGVDNFIWDNNIGTVTSKAIIPSVTKTYSVTGTDINGCFSSSAVTVLVNSLPTLNVSATKLTVCKDSSSTLSALGTGVVTFAWDNGLGNGSSIKVTPKVKTIYTVTGTDANSCFSATEVSVDVTTPTLPTVTSDVAITVNSIIPTLTASGTTIKWYDSNNILLTPNGSNTYVPTVDNTKSSITTYKVTNTVSNCESTPSIVTFTISSCTLTAPTVEKNTIAICKGEKFTPIIASGLNVQWYDQTGNLIQTSGGVLIPTQAGIYSATQKNGCEGPQTKVTINVNSLPTFTASATPSKICKGSSSLIEAVGNGITFEWDNAIGQNASKLVTPASVTTYTVTGSDLSGCRNTASVSVAVNQLPTVAISANTPSICNGQSATITTSGALSYVWDNSVATISESVTPKQTTTYSVTGTDANACKNISSVTLTVNALSTISVQSNPTICKGELATLTVDGFSSYLWNDNTTQSSLVVRPTQTSQYSVSGIDTKGCKSSASFTVTVNQLPTIVVTALPTAICSGKSATLSATGALAYNWDNGIGSTLTKDVTPVGTTTYSVTGTDANGCKGSTQYVLQVTTPVAPKTIDTTISLTAPIPTLNVNGTTVKWYDATGITLLTPTPSNSYTPATIDKTKINTFKVTNTVNGCESSQSSVSITVSSCTAIAPDVIPSLITSCKNDPSVKSFTATGTGIKWFDANYNLIPNTSNSYTPTAAGIYYATQNTAGCESKRTMVTATINELPIVSLPILSPVCISDKEVIITPNPLGGTFGSGVSTTGLFNPTATGSFKISYSYSDAKGCSNSATTTITVNALPTVIASADKLEICSGQSAILSATGANNYVWNNNGTGLSVSPVTNTTYTVTGIGSNGCKNTATVSIKVNAVPDLVRATGDTKCDGDNGVLVSTGATGTINWYNSSSTVSISNLPSITVSVAGTYKVTQIVNNCESKPTAVDFILNSRPTIVTVSNKVIYDGQLTALTAPQPVNWYDGNKILLTNTPKTQYTPTLLVKNDTILTFYVDVTSGTCKSAMTSVSYEINTSKCPAAPSTTTSTAICAGEKRTISVSGSNIKWYTSASGGISFNNTTSLDVDSAATFYVSQTNESCESKRTKIEVTLNPKPTVTVDAPAVMRPTDAPVVITVSPLGGTLSGDNIILSKFYPGATAVYGDKKILYTYANSYGCTTTIKKIIVVNQGTTNIAELIQATTIGDSKTQNALNNGLVSEKPVVGQYPKSAVTTLDSTIAVAKAVRDDIKSTQAQINEQTTKVTNAITVFDNSKVKTGNITVLNNLINSTQDTITSSKIGTTVGTYPQSAKNDLIAAEAKAKIVLTDSKATQAQIDNAIKELQAANTTFISKKNTGEAATGILFTLKTLSIKIGETKKIEYTIAPTGATAPELVWTSSNTNVLTVDSSGKVTAVGNGVAIITATFKNDPSKSTVLAINSVVGVDVVSSNGIELYPTLVNDVVYIKNISDVKSIQVVSTSGKIIKCANSNADVVILDVTDLAIGTYIIVLQKNDNSFETREISKQ